MARSFLVVGKTSVIITVWIWCWPRIRCILLCSTLKQRHLTVD